MNAPNSWVGKQVSIAVIGAGGNGAEVVDCLATFNSALIALGSFGIQVSVFDPGMVRQVNLVRQRFWASDIGQNKAIALVNRYNVSLGTSWIAVPAPFPYDDSQHFDIIITAVDVPSVRARIADLEIYSKLIWLDLGNMSSHGQAVLGEISKRTVDRHPNVVDLYPEIRNMVDDLTKSCSAEESLSTQGMLMNRMITTAAMPMIWNLLRHGKTDYQAVYVDLDRMKVLSESIPTISQNRL